MKEDSAINRNDLKVGKKEVDEAGTNYWFSSVEKVVADFQSDKRRGLSPDEAKRRLEKYGYNELGGGGGPKWYKVLMANFFNFMNIVLVLAVVLSCVVKNFVEAGIVVAIIVLNTSIGFVQEFKSGKTLEALRKMSSPTAIVTRSGDTDVQPCKDVVPGDIVQIIEGNIVPADIRLITAINLEVNEMMLTGEAMPVAKQEDALPLDDGFIPVGDRYNMAFKNTLVTRGRGTGIVVGTGMSTEIGSIAKSVSENESRSSKTPLERKLDRMMMFVFFTAVVLAVIVFAANKFVITSQVLLYAISVAVAMIPEGLPAVITVTMAIGVRRMAAQKAIVRKMSALEALGQVSHICSDKTGTLTEGKMVVTEAWIGQRRFEATGTGIVPEGVISIEGAPIEPGSELIEKDLAFSFFLKVSALCTSSNFFFDEKACEWKSSGDPTEVALQVFAEKVKVNAETLGFKLLAELPFDMIKKRMTVVYVSKDRLSVYLLSKGSVESILECADSFVSASGEVEPITERFLTEVSEKNVELAERGMRVLALAYRVDPSEQGSTKSLARLAGDERYGLQKREENESRLTFIGLAAIHDPPRAESKAAIRMCHIAGIHVHMATGDHRLTAESIARLIGILAPSSHPSLVMEAKDFEVEVKRREAERIAYEEELARKRASDNRSVLSAMSGAAKDSMFKLFKRQKSSNGASTLSGASRYETSVGHPLEHIAVGQEYEEDDDDNIDLFPPIVLARCAPESKVILIEELHRRGKFVAMTGDGVNDAPAVKRSDIGIAMGVAGSDVTKQASDLTLTDDNFSSIVKAIAEGRRIFANITKLTCHLLSTNVMEVIVLVIALAIRDQHGDALFPMSPIQILYVNMLTSSPIALALGCETASEDIMRLPPREKTAGLFTKQVFADIFAYGFVGGALSLISYILSVVFDVGSFNKIADCGGGHGGNFDEGTNCRALASASATAFYSLSFIIMWHGFNCRHSRRSFFKMNVKTNKILLFAILSGFILTVPTSYIPVINNKVFNQAPVTWQWAIIVPATLLFIIFSEVYKFILRRFFPLPVHYGTPIGLDIRNRRILSLPTNYADVVPITQEQN